VFATADTDLDTTAPTMKYWNNAGTFNAKTHMLLRTSGTYSTKALGICWSNGDLCGNFDPVLTSPACSTCP
ncbi:MAG: hypothetical protein HYY15_00720, partial [Candidatus Omnitrophica bacterium]|nr:hypothetical protein [Candidatus Omnitrophota bacterium]